MLPPECGQPSPGFRYRSAVSWLHRRRSISRTPPAGEQTSLFVGNDRAGCSITRLIAFFAGCTTAIAGRKSSMLQPLGVLRLQPQTAATKANAIKGLRMEELFTAGVLRIGDEVTARIVEWIKRRRTGAGAIHDQGENRRQDEEGRNCRRRKTADDGPAERRRLSPPSPSRAPSAPCRRSSRGWSSGSAARDSSPPSTAAAAAVMPLRRAPLGERHEQDRVGHRHADRHDRAHERLEVQRRPVSSKASTTPASTAGTAATATRRQPHRLEVRRQQQAMTTTAAMRAAAKPANISCIGGDLAAHVDLHAGRRRAGRLERLGDTRATVPGRRPGCSPSCSPAAACCSGRPRPGIVFLHVADVPQQHGRVAVRYRNRLEIRVEFISALRHFDLDLVADAGRRVAPVVRHGEPARRGERRHRLRDVRRRHPGVPPFSRGRP